MLLCLCCVCVVCVFKSLFLELTPREHAIALIEERQEELQLHLDAAFPFELVINFVLLSSQKKTFCAQKLLLISNNIL